MRWWSDSSATVAAMWAAVCCACAFAAASDTQVEPGKSRVIGVAVIPFSEETSHQGAAALSALVRQVLEARGVATATREVPGACAAAPGDAMSCARDTLAALARGALGVALVPLGAPPPAPELRDAGLDVLGEATPPARRACLAAPPARSLLDLALPDTAARYHLARETISSIASQHNASLRYFCRNVESSASPLETCDDSEARYASIVTDSNAEARLLRDVVREHGLLASVVAVEGAGATGATHALARRGAGVLCARGSRLPSLTRALGPPPCLADTCPFETRRLMKLVNVRELADCPSAIRSLARLQLDERALARLAEVAAAAGPEAAARDALAAHPTWLNALGEVRVAVMIPATTRREAYDALALRVAAELAEIDVANESSPTLHRQGIEFKVELIDDGCAATKAFKYLTDSLGSEFGALSGVAGPACGGAFGDVTRQSPAFSLPVVAYTAQARPPPPGAALALLAAGDAARYTPAWAALFALFGWRRVAVLSELATRSSFDQPHLGVEVLYHTELSQDGDDHDDRLIFEWAEQVWGVRGRVVYLCVEDARAVRAALCAGRRAGLTRAAGAVWALSAALPLGWTQPAPADTHNCTRADLDDMAEGHLTLAPEWAARWDEAARDAGAAGGWAARWAARCAAARGAACSPPSRHAALLYDALRLWAAALTRLLTRDPAALDDLHREHLVRSLIKDATDSPYTGITGAFEWENGARSSALVVQQWRNGSYVRVGEWRGRSGVLTVHGVQWGTVDGAAPDDGGERCALRALAGALRVECRVAVALAVGLALAALLAALAAVAWHCRRRAEREFRARLVALDMRAIATKPGGLDKWEVPRERVVINRKLGTGAFGTVYGGHALLAEDRGWSAVAVKTLKPGAATEEKLDFLSEAEAMKRFDHKNVVRLLGVVTKTEPVCTVMEFMLYGDLKNYLVARRHLAGAGGAAGAEVSPARLTGMALDVARALSYLAQLRYVHRDVAARNCLVSANRVVKLADFGMTRLVFENDYYRFSRKGMLPVRWMAPESLTLGVFSPASDVWSFGVLLYEIITFGSLPFQGLSNAEVLERVKAGHTLELPAGLKPQLEGLIKSCWQASRLARPRAAGVAAFLAESPRLLAPCVDAPLEGATLWAAPSSAATDCTYLSDHAPRDTDAFLPPDSDHDLDHLDQLDHLHHLHHPPP